MGKADTTKIRKNRYFRHRRGERLLRLSWSPRAVTIHFIDTFEENITWLIWQLAKRSR
jgi:hypothetical protein